MDDADLWILSYDVHGGDRNTASRVCHLIFGRRNSTTREGRPATYEQQGFIHRPGVRWIGQSVFLLPRPDAMELRTRLEAMGVEVGAGRLVMGPSDLTVFCRKQRRARRVSQ